MFALILLLIVVVTGGSIFWLLFRDNNDTLAKYITLPDPFSRDARLDEMAVHAKEHAAAVASSYFVANPYADPVVQFHLDEIRNIDAETDTLWEETVNDPRRRLTYAHLPDDPYYQFPFSGYHYDPNDE